VTGTLSYSSGVFSGNVLVTATNSSNGAPIFSKVYTVNVPASSGKAIFLLNVAVNPYPLSANILLSLSGGVWSSTVSVTRQIDILRHGSVDITDIAALAIGFNSKLGTSGYSPNADILSRGTIDIVDLATAAMFFGAPDYS
jgi:hypothetical protein